MTWSFTLARYLARHFMVSFLIIFAACLALTLLIDAVEMLRQHAARETVTPAMAIGMSLLKLPGLGQEILPFVVLFGAMWSFTRLTRSSELVVTRGAGVSVWQFLTPAVVIALLIGAFTVTVYNPFAAMMSSRYADLEARYLRGQDSQLAVSATGLWLRQTDGTDQSVVHALRLGESAASPLTLQKVIIFQYEGRDTFQRRLDAESARLAEPYWELENVWISEPDREPSHHERYRLPTTLTYAQIQESFASPKTLSFWDLPRFIQVAESAGFATTRHRLHWHATMAIPLLLAAMVIIAAVFSLRFNRLGGVTQLVIAGILTGFALFFLSDVTATLGQSGVLPTVLAAWAPAGIAMLLGVTLLLHLEDG
jgi:lipopolysaccharide export system permease protein